MILSILIPAIPERMDKVSKLAYHLNKQAEPFGSSVEILCLMDNMQMTIGEKRTRLKHMAMGKYFTFVDDDDWVTHDYVDEVLKAIVGTWPDVVTFDQITAIDGKPFKVSFGYGNLIEPARQDASGNYVDIKRPPWHVCVWRAEAVEDCNFPYQNYDEDTAFVKSAILKIQSSTHIDKVLHYYNYSSDLSRAHPE